jgi:hypothetical protein
MASVRAAGGRHTFNSLVIARTEFHVAACCIYSRLSPGISNVYKSVTETPCNTLATHDGFSEIIFRRPVPPSGFQQQDYAAVD